MLLRPPTATLFPTRRSSDLADAADLAELPVVVDRGEAVAAAHGLGEGVGDDGFTGVAEGGNPPVVTAVEHAFAAGRSEEHTSELQSHVNLVCRLLLFERYYN